MASDTPHSVGVTTTRISDFDDIAPHRQQHLARFAELMADAPPDEALFDTCRRVTATMASEYKDKHAQIAARQQLVQASTALIARERQIDRDWEAQLARAVLGRLAPSPDAEHTAALFASAAMGAVRATLRRWFEDPFNHFDDLEQYKAAPPPHPGEVVPADTVELA